MEKTVKISVTTDAQKGALIKDIRDNRYYFEEKAGIIRNFETLMGENISKNDAVVAVAKDAGVACTDIVFIY